MTGKCFLNFDWEYVQKFGAYDASGKKFAAISIAENVPIFGASHSIFIRHEKPFDQQSDFQEKLSEFDNIPNNKTPLLRKNREKLPIQGGIRQSDRFSARGQSVVVCPGKKAVE